MQDLLTQFTREVSITRSARLEEVVLTLGAQVRRCRGVLAGQSTHVFDQLGRPRPLRLT